MFNGLVGEAVGFPYQRFSLVSNYTVTNNTWECLMYDKETKIGDNKDVSSKCIIDNSFAYK